MSEYEFRYESPSDKLRRSLLRALCLLAIGLVLGFLVFGKASTSTALVLCSVSVLIGMAYINLFYSTWPIKRPADMIKQFKGLELVAVVIVLMVAAYAVD